MAENKLYQNLPQTQEKPKQESDDQVSTLDWARKRFEEMSPKEKAEHEKRFLKLTRLIID